MDNLCGSPFWDNQITWDTTDPFFTHCFEETVLIWSPAGFLILLSFLDIYFSLSCKRTDRLPWNIFNSIKCVVCIALIAISIAQISVIQSKHSGGGTIDILAPVIRLISYVLAVSLIVLSKLKGIRASGVQFLFWFIAFACELILFRTAVRKYSDNGTTKVDFIYLMRLIIFPLVVIQLILNCWAEGSWPWTNSKNGGALFGFPCPEKNSSYLSKVLYLWYDGLAWKGYRKPLSYADLWDLNAEDKSDVQVPRFYKHWDAAVNNAKLKSKQTGKKVDANVVGVLYKAFGKTFMVGGIFKLVQDLLAFVSPEILKKLVAHIANPDEESWKGFLYAGILLAVSLFQTLVGVQYNKRMMITGMRVRTALSGAIYRKALIVSNEAKKDSTVGEIVNLMSVDTQRFMDLTPFFHMLWTSPIQIAVSLFFLYRTLGPSIFAGLAVMIILIPVNGFISTRVRGFQMKQMLLKDDRIKLMSELLSGMKVLKLYGWEPSFQEQIQKIRDEEMVLLRKIAALNVTTYFSFNCAPFLVSLATFAVYVLTDDSNVLNAENSFVALTLFNIMRMPLTMFPLIIGMMLQAAVSVNRINRYMNSEEINPDAVTHDPTEECPISIKNGTFSWTSEAVTLRNVNFSVKKGSLVAVVGTVGSGKTSLLSSLLGDLKKSSGHVNLHGSVAYVAQGAWIQNATLKDNILFNDTLIESKYKRVIDVCALGPDLELLPTGDQTEIGEKGINLSGGQKQRVALARAAYKESDIYLWDDPLSAVDSHVGKHIFDKLIGPNGILKNKTRVLVTHGVSFLPQVDNIVVMKDGQVSEMGTFKELLTKKGNFSEFLAQHLGNSEGEEIDDALISELEGVVGVDVMRRNSSKALARRSSSKREGSLSTQKRPPVVEPVVKSEKLIQEETAETGNIKLSVFVDYISAAGLTLSIVTVVFNVLSAAAAAYSSVWLSNWATEATRDEILTGGFQDKDTTNLYLGVYGALGGFQAITILVGTLSLAYAANNSAAELHYNMLKKVMRAPMSYFDTTPLGRLVNRFAKDVDTVDNLVPSNIRGVLIMLLNVIATFIVISYSTPIFIAFIIPCSIVYVFLQRFYVATSRQLKRIESVSRSPIYSKFGETISGATTIRAFGLQEEFIADSEMKIDNNQKAYYPYIAANLWVAVRLESLGSVVIFAAALFAVLARKTIDPSVVGLSVSYALSVTMLLNFIVRLGTDLETNIIAVERITELMGIPQEADWVMEKRPPKDWPQSGAVQFTNYETRYREGLDLVLRGISCSIQPGEKVGIVGRTGAGKSSLTLALFRLVEPANGTIHIDGQDVTQIGLHDLRSKITIIPQDPVLFSGNLRINLDPFEAYTDDQVWTCLESAHLKTYVSSLPAGLLYEVAEEGQNFSVGQRQLVCLARALLRKTMILVLDEATAAVDLETDDLIQKTIRNEFANATVITIAHRLNTIMDSNRVVVLDKGQIVEFESPENLLANPSSIFYGMAKDAGLV